MTYRAVMGSGILITAAWTKSPDEIEHYFSYDDRGRRTVRRQRAEGIEFSLSASYTLFGLVDKLTYPQVAAGSSLSVRMGHGSDGTISNVTNATTGKPYWELKQLDADGHTMSETFGNGVTTTRTYHASNGRLRGLRTAMGSSTVIDNSVHVPCRR